MYTHNKNGEMPNKCKNISEEFAAVAGPKALNEILQAFNKTR